MTISDAIMHSAARVLAARHAFERAVSEGDQSARDEAIEELEDAMSEARILERQS